MGKVLSQSGTSLADAYDVLGSVAGINQIRTEEVQLVHDMAPTLTMERMAARIFVMATAATAASTAFAVALTPPTASAMRVYGVVVQVDTTSRMTEINLTARDPTNATEIPIWRWDGTNEDTIRMDDGTALADQIVLRPDLAYNPLPMNMFGIDLLVHVNQFRLRGTTSAFGAGTVLATAQIYIAFIDAPGALSSKGVPIPSW